MPRIVLAPVGSLGDLHPSLALARELSRRGHVVIVATHPGYRARVEAAGVGFAPVRPDLGDGGKLAETMEHAMHERRGSEYVVRELVLPHLRDSYADLLAACAGADAIVSHLLSFAAPIVAERLGLPRFAQLLQPVAMLSAHDPGVWSALPAPRWFSRRGPAVWRVLWGLSRRASRPWFRPVDALRADAGLPPSAAHPLFDGFSPELNLASFPAVLAPPQPDWPPHTVVTGACVYDRDERGAGLPPAVAEFLDRGEPPVAFSLGSSGVWDPGLFYEAAGAACAALGVRGVLLVGPEPRGVPWPLPSGVIAVDYAPHGELFPRAAVIVHHGGIGTTAQALRAGRPMVIVPYSHDQPDNAWRCERLGVARVVPRRALTADRLTVALHQALGDRRMAASAMDVGRTVRAEDGAHTAADAIEHALAPHVAGLGATASR